LILSQGGKKFVQQPKKQKKKKEVELTIDLRVASLQPTTFSLSSNFRIQLKSREKETWRTLPPRGTRISTEETLR